MEYIKINKMKKENEIKSSEELLGLYEPVDFQCPKFDEVIKALRSIEKDSEVKRYYEFEDLKTNLDSINWDVYHLIDTIEELRTAIGNVRDWGSDWKKLCKKIIENEEIDVKKYIY